MAFFDLFKTTSQIPFQKEAHQFTTMFVKYRRKYPDRPIRDSIKPALPFLRMMIPANSPDRPLFDLISSEEYQVNSVQDLSCAVVALITSTPVDGSERYQEIVTAVKAETRKTKAEKPKYIPEFL